MLRTHQLAKRFGGLAAVRDLSLHVRPGEIHALIGPNGAGKTTVLNLITGLYQPDSGSIEFAGQSLVGLKPHMISRLGIARTFQNLRLFKEQTVLANVAVAAFSLERTGLLSALFNTRAARAEQRRVRERVLELLDLVGLAARCDDAAGSLPYGQQKLLEIARALATRPRLLLLDEPAAGLNDSETGALIVQISRIRAMGVTVLLIEHNMPLVMGLADRLTVLNFGETIASGEPAAVRRDARVIEAYLGRGVADAQR